jgi:arylsulfatase A-like enzyme
VSAARPDILLISIDSLRADHVGSYGYERNTTPTIDRLAAVGARFANAISTTSWTLPAHAAMFTGLYDSAHGTVDVRHRLQDEHVTLAELLQDAGYQTSGFFGGPFLHPSFGLHQGFSAYLNCMTLTPEDVSDEALHGQAHRDSHRDVTGPRTLERLREWLPSVGDRPIFVFLHLWDVHFDYVPPQHYVDMFDPDYTGDVTAEGYLRSRVIRADMPARDLEHVIALYDGEIRYTDDIIGEILAELDEAGRFERALIAVTSDHGEEFFEHGGRGHMKSLFEEVVRVPLIVRWPGHIEAGRVIEDQVRLIDLMPTLLSLAGLPVPAEVQGRDLSPLLFGDSLPTEPALLELLALGRQMRALRTNDYKLLVDEVTGAGAFFDLHRNAGETGNHVLTEGRPNPTAQRAMTALRELSGESQSRAIHPGRSAGRADRDEALTRRLRSLGYLEGEVADAREGEDSAD